MATQLEPQLIERAKALGLFGGDPKYYFPDGGADADERDNLVHDIIQTALRRIELAKS